MWWKTTSPRLMWRGWSSRRDPHSRRLLVWAAGGLQTLLSGSQRLRLQRHHVPVRAKEPLQLPRQQLLPASGPVQTSLEPWTLPRWKQEWWACLLPSDGAAMLISLLLKVVWALLQLHLCLCAVQPTVQTVASASARLGRILPAGESRRLFRSSKMPTLRPWDPTLMRSGNTWVYFIPAINCYYRTKYMTVLALGRKTPGDWLFFNFKIFYKPALFIHIYPSPSSLQSWI